MNIQKEVAFNMVEPEKPFACTLPDCGMTFTNEDHLQFHTKKHDMVLQLGIEQKGAFVVDQTPTPTRFIRNCEEMGLFQDLQNVNPFDEGFKRAMETKTGILTLENAIAASTADDVLHTPQMVFPIIDGESALYTNNQRNITISRSSSDESGAVKEYETTTISKMTNEVTISRVVGKPDILLDKITTDDVAIKHTDDVNKNKETVSYTNNVIKIHSNVEIRKDVPINMEANKNPVTLISYTDSVIKDASVINKDVLLTDSNKLQVPELKIPPIMSQKSLDFVVDSLTSECQNETPDKEKDVHLIKMLKRNYNAIKRSDEVRKTHNRIKCENKRGSNEKEEGYEVIIKLPNGKHVRMKAVEEIKEEKKIQDQTKEKLKKVLTNKVEKKSQLDTPILHRLPSLDNTPVIQNILPIPTGTLIPVTIVNPVASSILLSNNLQKIPIAINPKPTVRNTAKRVVNRTKVTNKRSSELELGKNGVGENLDKKLDEDCVIVEDVQVNARRPDVGLSRHSLNSARSAASKRYRERLKIAMKHQAEENKLLRGSNTRLAAENATLKLMITNHMKKCSNADDLSTT